MPDQTININFGSGLDTKTDPWQVAAGRFLALKNMVFQSIGRLTKRNGYSQLSSLPSDQSSSYLTTFNGDLQALGDEVLAYSPAQSTWIEKGNTHPIQLSTLPLVVNSLAQTQCDSAVSLGLVCTVYTETNGSSNTYKYVIADAATGQNIVEPTIITPTSGTVTGALRVFVVGSYFIIGFTNLISGTSHLRYIAISTTDPTIVTTDADLASAYTPESSVSWDGVVVSDTLYFAYYFNNSGSPFVRVNTLSQILQLGTPTTFTGGIATCMSVSVDLTSLANPNIFITYYNSGTSSGTTASVNAALQVLMSPTATISQASVVNVTSLVQAQNSLVIMYEIGATIGYDGGIQYNRVVSVVCSYSGTPSTTGSVAPTVIIVRGAGLASKGFLNNGLGYVLATYSSQYQPTLFLLPVADLTLIPGASPSQYYPIPISKLAPNTGGGYLTTGLPSVSAGGTTQSLIPYLFKDQLDAQAPTEVDSINAKAPSIFTSTGVKLATFTFESGFIIAKELGQNLLVNGGFLWGYDGFQTTEQNFLLYPDFIEAAYTSGGAGGNIAAKPDGSTNTNAYWYQVTYEWTDNQGNLFRSSPSVAIPVTTTGSGVGTITLNIPCAHLTYKSDVQIVIYRWSVENQTYFQVTSVSVPTYSTLTSDYITYIDLLADASIVGNNIIYTTGGVVEDTNGPACQVMNIFDTRLWVLDAENPNNFWYSKNIIPGTTVEMSALFTYYVDPNLGAEGPTGDITAAFPMDDKFIIFKANAIYYINGTGPDITGANSTYPLSPIFITSQVGCSNQNSIVMTDQGLMFQSSKGIWLLNRFNLQPTYIGAPVEQYNSYDVTSAVAIPQSTQLRFAISNGLLLLYDTFTGQWGTFEGIPSISATLYQDLHTVIDSYGRVFQEGPGTYLDGQAPVLMSFTTSWINLASLQGYERFKEFSLLANFLSPHSLLVQVAYDYNPSIVHQDTITPKNFSSAVPSPFGAPVPYGGPGSLEQWRIHSKIQLCQSFQITVTEVFNPAYGTVPGAGFTMSGISATVDIKKARRPIAGKNSAGVS